MSKKREVVSKENIIQAILVADTFEDEFVPISNDVPLCLFPVVNKPLIDYTLEFLSLGGVEETFLFCCNHVAEIKSHIRHSIDEAVGWTLTMKVHIIVSESCRSFGDCLRDLDAKGLLRGDFVLLEPGVISNVQLSPLLKKHSEICQMDKGAAMTLIYQESAIGHISLCPEDETVIAVTSKNRVLFHKKTRKTKEKKVEFPLEIFLENSSVSLLHNLKDTHISICSSFVLPLFSDNFDFQTKDDFVRGLLMNEEIMGSTVYCNILKGSDYGGAISNWRMYQAISLELKNKWIYPLIPSVKRNRLIPEESVITKTSNVALSANLTRSILGQNVAVGENVTIQDSFIFENTLIEDNSVISLSIIGPDCVIKKGAKVTAASILGKGVVIDEDKFVENSLVQATESDDPQPEDKIGEAAYRLRVEEDEDDLQLDKELAKQMSRMHIYDTFYESDYESEEAFSESEEDLSYTHSPPPDDTKLDVSVERAAGYNNSMQTLVESNNTSIGAEKETNVCDAPDHHSANIQSTNKIFFTEVIDSLTRGYEDKLLCDNLILEINSSRYAYNVTVKEVNFNVIKAILTMSQKLSPGSQYLTHLSKMLTYFSPIFTNYIKKESAMIDCLQAIEDVAISNGDLNDKWIIFILKYLYEKDFLNEDSILGWFANVKKGTKLHSQVKPFADWLKEAEEEDSSEEESG